MKLSIIPDAFIDKFIESNEYKFHYNIALSNLIILFAVFNIKKIVILLNIIPHICLFQYFLNIPCPGCGITRSLISLSNLEIIKSIKYNIAGIFVLAAIIIHVFINILYIKKYKFNYDYLSKRVDKITISVLLLNWLIKLILQIGGYNVWNVQ